MAKIRKTTASIVSRPLSAGLLVTTGLLLVGGSVFPAWRQVVLADQYQDQINALQQENATNQSQLDSLAAQASSYADAITKLQAQIDGLQKAIDANVALQADLQKQIAEAQAEIDRQRQILASDLRAMYVDGTPTSLEMLASSQNLSDFVDKQEYRTRVQTKLQDTLKKIAKLQNQLQVQKAKVEQLLKEQQSQQDQLASSRTEMQNLLTYNESQQQQFNSKIESNNAQVASLRAQQIAANRRLTSASGGASLIAGDSGRGGYPSAWANAEQDSMLDNWGMYNRECVSYAAWKVYQTYGHMPYWGGIGNAYEWPGNAARAGIPTSNQPRARSVAIGTNPAYFGGLGHAMWVESVNSDGSISVSQYNWYNGGWGNYSEMKLGSAIASSLTYIYFN